MRTALPVLAGLMLRDISIRTLWAPLPRLPRAQLAAQLVVRVGRDVVELIDRDQAVVECLYAVGIDREAEGRMGADQHLVVAFEECAEGLDLAAVIVSRRVTQVPRGFDMPV